MNNKGFTLVELLATILLLALISSIAAYSITVLVKRAKQEDYNLLISNIRDGAESYYQECKYSRETILSMFNNDEASANEFCNGNITLGELVTYGYVNGNSTDNNNRKTIVNTNDDESISNCAISVRYDKTSGKVIVSAVSPSGSCPTEY